MDAIVIEDLISAVEKHPVIWDKTLETYKDRYLRETAWREICIALKEEFEDFEHSEKLDFCKLLVRKWTQLRDSWMKNIKAKELCKKAGNRPSRPYLYYNQLSFLCKITNTDNNETTNSHSDREDSESEDESASTSKKQSENKNTISRKRKSDKTNPEAKAKTPFIDCHTTVPSTDNYEDRNMTFFKSIIPSLAYLDDDETLEFHSGVLKLLQVIKKRRENMFSYSIKLE